MLAENEGVARKRGDWGVERVATSICKSI